MIAGEPNPLRIHRHPSSSSAIPLLTLVFLLSLSLTACDISAPSATPTRTQPPSAPGEGVAVGLPPFEMDPLLPDEVVLNPDQGLGQCHWLDPDLLSSPSVTWAYDASESISGWSTIEPEEGVFNWGPLDAEIAKARSLGKRIWIELHTTEGHTPQWARDAGVELVGSRGGTPLPWNETYQRLLRRAIHAMAARYDGQPGIDAVNVMAGGCYGEMTICAANFDQRAWEDAGYTDQRFLEAVKQIVDIYLEDEYTWEDGSKTHGFQKTPVVLQLGAGLYGHTRPVIEPVIQYLMPKYGMRVWLKYNGWGGGFEMRWVYQDYDTITRVGYEPAGNSPDFLDNPGYYIEQALNHHSSYVCLQRPYYDIDDAAWQEARAMAARYLGAQIVFQGAEAPDTVAPGLEYVFTTNWVNRGTAALMRPQRQGTRDIAVSYDILLAFVDPGSGAAVFEHMFTPSVPTTQWYSAQPVVIAESVSIPDSVPAGTYDLRVALVNPELPAADERRYFQLVNVDLHDGSGRYTVGQIAVDGGGGPTLTPTSTPRQPDTPADLPPVIFVMLDWMNGDWGNPDYYFYWVDEYGYKHEYFGHPEYGALGGWAPFEWRDLNPGKGSYNWSKTDKYIKDAQSMQVTLPNGSVIAKPVGISVQTWSMEETDSQYGINYTPGWVAAEMGTSPSSCTDPDGAGGCKPFCTPRFRDETWQYWFDQFIIAMGQHYDNNPEFYNLAFINIATGADDETNERKNIGGCDYYGGNSKPFDDWVLRVMETYNLAFPNTVQFIQSTLHGIHIHAEHAASFPSRMTGVKVNGLEMDVPSAEVRLDGVLVGGVTGFSEVWHDRIPTGYEPKHGNGVEGSYWFYMQGLSTHPYMFDMQLTNIADTYTTEQVLGFPIHDFVRNRLGKMVQNAPDVWIVLRETYASDTTWTGSDGVVRTYGPHHGDFSYWLYRPDSAPGSQTFALQAEYLDELPSQAREHIYAWHSTRRTDQASGNPYMSFDVDDRYRHAGLVPKAAGGEVSWVITMTFVNSGTDTLSLEYKDYYGNPVEQKIAKGPALGPADNWVDYTWRVDDAYFNNGLPGGTDFRIDCNDDGNEIVHRLIVSSEGPPAAAPTPTKTLGPSPTPTRTTTPPTPTPTRTASPTAGPSPTPTNTVPPSATPTAEPSPTPESTPTLFPGGQNVVTLQQGVDGYQGNSDTYISAWTPGENFGDQGAVQVKNDSVMTGLLRFDLRSIPPGSTINQATLKLYAYYRGSSATFDLEAYRALRPWVDMEATWDLASAGNPWGLPGGNDTNVDRAATRTAVQTVGSVDTWFELDVTELVGEWVANPGTNHGVLLRGAGPISVIYHFASANYPTMSLRPQLQIDYTAPEVPATPTPATPTSTEIPTITPTGTATPPTPTPTGTPTGLASPTHTPTVAPSATLTTGPSSTPTSTPTAFPGGRNVVTLQQGVQGYQGTNDTYIAAWSPASSFAQQGKLLVKNDSVYASLLRFELGSVPAGSTIHQATLRVYAVFREQDQTLNLELYRLLRRWVDAEASWNRASDESPWGQPGANDTTADRRSVSTATKAVYSLNAWYELDITQLVSAWVANPGSNYGVILRGAGSIPATYHFASANYPTISLRPQLVIDYTAPQEPITPTPTGTSTGTPTSTATGVPSGTPTEVVTPSPTPSPVWTERTVTLQQGSGGYTGSEDTYIYRNDPNSNHCEEDQFRVGFDQTYYSLIYFDLTSIPSTGIVTKANLELYATGWGGSNITIYAHCIKRPVSLCEATWNEARSGDPWGQPGCNDTVTDRCADFESRVTSAGIRRWYGLDLTGLVQDWVSGNLPNNGLVLRAPGSSGSLWFAGAQNADLSLRPKLVITYRLALTPTITPTPPVTATPTATSTPTATATLVPSITPTTTPVAEERVADMERRVGILEQLLRAIIDIFLRSGRIGR